MKFRCRQSEPLRRGVAASELAVCLPVIILLVLGTIECCTMIFLKQSLTVAAYEGARVALEEGALPADVQAVSDGVLRDRRINGGVVTIRPANFDALPAGEYVEVTVTAPAFGNSVIPGSFFRGRQLQASAEMMKEY